MTIHSSQETSTDRSDSSLEAASGPAHSDPLQDRRLSPQDRLAKAIEQVDEQIERLGEALVGTSDGNAQHRISEELATLAEKRANLESGGLQLVHETDALQDFRDFELTGNGTDHIPKQFKILQDSNSPAVIDLLAGKDGLQSSDPLRVKLALQICVGKQDERIAAQVLQEGMNFNDLTVEALIAVAHLRDPRAPKVLGTAIPNLNDSEYGRLVENIDGALRRRGILRIGIASSDTEKQVEAIDALKPGDSDILLIKLEKLLTEQKHDVLCAAVGASGRIWDDSLKTQFESSHFQHHFLGVIASLWGVNFREARPAIEVLAQAVNERIKAGSNEPAELKILAYDPTPENIAVLLSSSKSANQEERQAAIGALCLASNNLSQLGDPQEVAKRTKLDRMLEKTMSDADPLVRMEIIASRSPTNTSHRKALMKLIAKEKDKIVARAISDKMFPFHKHEEGPFFKALEKNGHNSLRVQLLERQFANKRRQGLI